MVLEDEVSSSAGAAVQSNKTQKFGAEDLPVADDLEIAMTSLTGRRLALQSGAYPPPN